MRNCSKILASSSTCDLWYALDVLIGKISSMRLQYNRNASDVQPPVAATISGSTPARSSSTAPPMRKLWPRTWERVALDHTLVQNPMNLCLAMCSHWPVVVVYANREVDPGKSLLILRWLRM